MTTRARATPVASGPKNRIVDLQRRVVTRDSLGGEVTTWQSVENVWATVRVTGVSENFVNDANRAVPLRNGTVLIVWRNDVTELHRIVYDGLAWDIKGIREVGFRRELLLYCQTDASRKV